MLQNQWKQGACFQEVESASKVEDPAAEEARIRRRESDATASDARDAVGGAVNGVETSSGSNASRHRHFKWAPRFTDVFESVEKAGPGSDGWAVKQGETSVTALRANFMHIEGLEGELKL
jgi:hypothetical protein